MAAANPTDFVISSQELETENPETVFQLVEKLGEGYFGYKDLRQVILLIMNGLDPTVPSTKESINEQEISLL